jgi:hypothetical protein
VGNHSSSPKVARATQKSFPKWNSRLKSIISAPYLGTLTKKSSKSNASSAEHGQRTDQEHAAQGNNTHSNSLRRCGQNTILFYPETPAEGGTPHHHLLFSFRIFSCRREEAINTLAATFSSCIILLVLAGMHAGKRTTPATRI